MSLLAALLVATAWPATAAPSNEGCSNIALPIPERVLDTRDVVVEPAGPNVGFDGPLAANGSVKLKVAGPITVGALGTKTVIPTGASTFDFNVTVLRNTVGGFISLRPGDATGVPGTSSENFAANSAGSNNFGSVAISSSGEIDIYYGSAAGATTEVILDVISYCATDSVSVPPTTPTTAPTTPINVSERNWSIDWQGDRPGVASDAPDLFDQVRFGITSNKISDAEPSDNGNASDGGDDSYATNGGDVCKDSNSFVIRNGRFGGAPGFTPVGTPTSWEFYNLTCNSDATLIEGNYRRTDGTTDTGIFQMYPQGTTVSPLPDPVVPALPFANSGPTCTSGDDLPDATRTFVFTGAVPGVAPFPDTRIDVNFAVTDGDLTNQSSVRHDGTDPPYTWANGQILCEARVMNVLMNNTDTSDPATADRGRYRFQNVRDDGGDLIGEYGYDSGNDGVYEDVGTFRTQ